MPLPLPLPCGIASISILILLEVGFNWSVEFSFFYKVQSLIGEIIELISKTLIRLCMRLAKIIFTNLFYYSTYICYYSKVSLHFLILFMSSNVLFQLIFIFIFIYCTFSKKFSIAVK